jgi:hypothetical protein
VAINSARRQAGPGTAPYRGDCSAAAGVIVSLRNSIGPWSPWSITGTGRFLSAPCWPPGQSVSLKRLSANATMSNDPRERLVPRVGEAGEE